MICSPQFVGGADASQKGLRQGMPQKVVASVALGSGKFGLQPRGYADARALSVRDRVYDFASPIGAVAAGENFGVRGLAGRAVNEDAAAFCLQRLGESGQRTLSDG